jgi:hypothetical protein
MKKSAGSIGRRVLKLSLLLVGGVVLAVSTTGCATPGYSASERANIIARNIDLEWKMAQDDIDRALLLRPLTLNTDWNIR